MRKHLWIHGEWKETTDYRKHYSPFSNELIAEVATANIEEVNLAIETASDALKEMKKLSAHERSSILYKVAELLRGRKDEFARLITSESAKPITTAMAEVERTIMTYTFAAEEARRIHGETISMDAAPGGENRIAYTIRQPLGVIAAITPFNFPLNLVAHKIGPAIAAGNTIVLKPATQTPLCAYAIAELFHEAGLPKGALNVVSGSGAIVGDCLVKHSKVKAVSFTGSPEVGSDIQKKAGLKRVLLELGSNSGVIIDENVKLDNIISRITMGAFSFAGQVCISLQRIYVHEHSYDEFIELFKDHTKKVRLGNPYDPKVEVSTMISKDETDRALSWINEAVQNGAEVVYGGNVLEGMLQPTILSFVQQTEKVSCMEVFAPIVIVNKISSIDQGISEINHSEFGLQAGIFTNDIETALKAADELEVGGVMINDIPTFRVDHMPYGGVKGSGLGREGIKYAIEELTELKLISWVKKI
ncbi:aldehyde dehydrogenase family protein [Bacillus salitolerans]|uniref:Aldehyde dehydrogenase family protein n=1 Tax=Bacillus salitolerans TaxID=1437434 RepID=A0ABW4LTG3_9BACI